MPLSDIVLIINPTILYMVIRVITIPSVLVNILLHEDNRAFLCAIGGMTLAFLIYLFSL